MEGTTLILVLILSFILVCITFLMYCIIVGGSISKSKEEREKEDEEQIKFINSRVSN